ncbi:MAG: glycosyltransferase family 4 protein [Cyanobacteriota bacterium]|nr:glycosyltransferase family 4 protein [Cyanobacteriota bacterium]
MKVCLVSRSDNRSGAAAAAYRLHLGLRQSGINSTMLVGEKTRNDTTIVSPENQWERKWVQLAPKLESVPVRFYRQRNRARFSTQWLSDRVANQIAKIDPDIINLHWICGGYLQIETLAQFRKPIVWTLHDMWPFTGGCHYSQTCDRYTQSCGACPHLNSQFENDLSRWVWQRKARAWRNLNLTIVTPSRWLAQCARASRLFRDFPIEIIANSLNTRAYQPTDKCLAKKQFELPQDKQILLFGAILATSDRRKGYHLLKAAIEQISQTPQGDNIEVIVFGASQPSEDTQFALKTHYFGTISDDAILSLLYSSADVFVAPSVEDNLPNTVMEALACGTPCVAFKIGGMPDLIEHRQNGYLAQPFAVEDFSKGVLWVLEDKQRHSQLRKNARSVVEQKYRLQCQSQHYISLFERLN